MSRKWIGSLFVVFFCSMLLPTVFAERSDFQIDQEKLAEKQETILTVEYPEFEHSVALLRSVAVLGTQEMSYCSLIARMNLSRFTGLPLTSMFGQEDAILQGDAIRLIEWGLATNTFLSLHNLPVDMNKYFADRSMYRLFDLYIYTPHPHDTISEKEYFLQGHRVVLLSTGDDWWVMDPLRGSKSASRQSRERYKEELAATAYLFVYQQPYAFTDAYEVDDMIVEQGEKNTVQEVNNLSMLVHQNSLVPELDTNFMPLAHSFLQPATLAMNQLSLSFSVGTVIKSMDESPFNVGLLTFAGEKKGANTVSMVVSLPGKELLFSHPVQLIVDPEDFFPRPFPSSYLLETTTGCDSLEEAQDGSVFHLQKNKLTFPICRTGVYTLTPLLENEAKKYSKYTLN